MRDRRFDILFEPVQIGPVVARNRFYQVPHCNGMGYRDIEANAAMRGAKAEGGWSVVCTEQVEIHPTSDICPYIELRLWDDSDIAGVAKIAEAIHEHDALAGIELAHNGMHAPNNYSREVPLGPVNLPVASVAYDPVQTRRMDKDDIGLMRQWHKSAALRARQAGFDLVYVYAGHTLSILHHFLSREFNDRSDEYGGSLENRVRLMRELVEDIKAAVGDRCAVPVRLSLDELRGPVGLERAEVEDMIGLMAELPDLWDVSLASWENDSRTARFAEEGYQEPFTGGVKALTTKPVVGVGRYTSPDGMVRLIKQGIFDFIGAARPSIADPFLPKKIEEGRVEEIRECIGCNICVSGDNGMAPIRCTQNPAMGEEWRKGWHPERVQPKGSETKILIIGAGPAGLEAACALGQRGYDTVLAEGSQILGGRVVRESNLPGLQSWVRVRDYRTQKLSQIANVEIYLESALDADQVLSFGFNHIVLATGSTWRRDGVGRQHTKPIKISDDASVLTPDDLMRGCRPKGQQVLIFDDDHYYMGGVLAELLVTEGYKVTLITPASDISAWTNLNLEQHAIQKRLLNMGVQCRTRLVLQQVTGSEAVITCAYTGKREAVAVDDVVLVTARLPETELIDELFDHQKLWRDSGILSVKAIGDALAPATIAHAVYGGHRYAEELDERPLTDNGLAFRRK